MNLTNHILAALAEDDDFRKEVLDSVFTDLKERPTAEALEDAISVFLDDNSYQDIVRLGARLASMSPDQQKFFTWLTVAFLREMAKKSQPTGEVTDNNHREVTLAKNIESNYLRFYIG